MSSDYQEPRWSNTPTPSTWSLEEIKNGTILQTYPLNSNCTTFGRAADQVSIPTVHPSCSRLHARIAFQTSPSDPIGTPWLRDLGSGHGTFVNKKPLPKKSIGKLENETGEGSRGVIIFPGDMIQFGASTRMFCLVGPPEKDRQFNLPALHSINNKTPALSKLIDEKKENQSQNDETNGISWGLDLDFNVDDDLNHEGESSKISNTTLSPIDFNSVPPKQQKKFQRLTAKKHKMANLQLESERIMKKGIEGLTAGQSAQLEKNTRREATLKQEIEALEQDIRDAIDAKNGANTKKHKKKRKLEEENEYNYEDDDVDDFYDRTKKSTEDDRELNRNINNIDEAETEEELTAKWTQLLATLNNMKSTHVRASAKVNNLEARISRQTQKGEDIFFLTNDLQLAQENLTKIQKSELETINEIETVEKMLKVCTGNTNMVFNRETKNIFQNGEINREKEKESIVEDNSSSKSSSQFIKKTSTFNEMPPPPDVVVNTKTSSFPHSLTSETHFDMPPPSRPTLLRAQNQNIQTTNLSSRPVVISSKIENKPANACTSTKIGKNGCQNEVSLMPPPPPMLPVKGPRIMKVKGPTILPSIPNTAKNPQVNNQYQSNALSMASFFTSRKKDSFTYEPETKQKQIDMLSKQQKKLVKKQDFKEDTWKAPEGQDGSGRTKLNAKFAGRY